jgi:hypothetical protein
MMRKSFGAYREGLFKYRIKNNIHRTIHARGAIEKRIIENLSLMPNHLFYNSYPKNYTK